MTPKHVSSKQHWENQRFTNSLTKDSKQLFSWKLTELRENAGRWLNKTRKAIHEQNEGLNGDRNH